MLVTNTNNYNIVTCHRIPPTGARVNTIVAPPGGIFTNAEIEQVSLWRRPLQGRSCSVGATFWLIRVFSHGRPCLNSGRWCSSSPTESLPQGSCILWTASGSCATSECQAREHQLAAWERPHNSSVCPQVRLLVSGRLCGVNRGRSSLHGPARFSNKSALSWFNVELPIVPMTPDKFFVGCLCWQRSTSCTRAPKKSWTLPPVQRPSPSATGHGEDVPISAQSNSCVTHVLRFEYVFRQKISQRRTKPVSFFLDLGWLANYWGCDGKPARLWDVFFFVLCRQEMVMFQTVPSFSDHCCDVSGSSW